MESITVALISVMGTLVGTFLGGWVSVRAMAKQHALQRQDQELRQRDDAFHRCVVELEAYRRIELNRVHEAERKGVSTADAELAPAVRDARSVCRRALLAFKIHNTEVARTSELEDIFAHTETIADCAVPEARERSATITTRLDAAVLDYSRSRQARLAQ